MGDPDARLEYDELCYLRISGITLCSSFVEIHVIATV